MQIQLENVRIAFCNSLHVKKSVMEGKPQHSATFIMTPGQGAHKLLEQTIQEVGTAKWGAKWKQIEKELRATNKVCIKDGDVKAGYAGFEGNYFVSASNSRSKIGVYDQDANMTDDESLIYAGCQVNGVIDVWAQAHQSYGKRINATLIGVQFVKDGESFGAAAVSTANLFKPVDVELVEDELAELMG